MDSDLKEAPLPLEAHTTFLGSAHRRLALLISLVVGLVLFFIWLPSGARAALFAALRAQWALVGMLFLFALIAVSLVWSAGQRLDTWIFLFFNLRGYHPRLKNRKIQVSR